jgi:hypothetical protein
MSEVLKQFVETALPVPGLSAWALRLPDGQVLARCCNEAFAPTQVEQIAAALWTAGKGLEPHGLQPIRACWVFERARLYLGLRREGAGLALLVENRPDFVRGEIERILQTFVQMPRTW